MSLPIYPINKISRFLSINTTLKQTCEVLKPVRKTYPTQPPSLGRLTPLTSLLLGPGFDGGSCWTMRVPPLIRWTLEWTSKSKIVSLWAFLIGSYKISHHKKGILKLNKQTFIWGIDSPVSMASSTISLPRKSSTSQGTWRFSSSDERIRDMISPTTNSSLLICLQRRFR